MVENINRIEPIPPNYERFTKLIKTAAGKAFPRGHGQDNISCWSKECNKLLNEYEQRQYDVTVNLPQGSVFSPTLYNIYTADIDEIHLCR